MALEIAGLAGICLLVIAANLGQARRDTLSSPAGSTLPRSIVDGFWRLIGMLCHRLNIEERARFEPDNLVHRAAALLMLTYTALVMAQLARGSAVAGTGFERVDLLSGAFRYASTNVLYLMLSLLGVGWLTRRALTTAVKRLGLSVPNRRDWLEGTVLAIALFALAQAGVALWAWSVAPADFEAQSLAARNIFEAFSATLPAGIMLALASAIGEEILVRGALQPIFGIAVSSSFFVLLHTQYLFTPAALMLFLVSLGFGWIRYRRGTSAAIICHAAYNMLPFLIHRLAI